MRGLLVALDALAGLRETAPVDLAAASVLAELAGADGVRVGVFEDGRPVREADLRDLRRAARTLELRMAPAPALVKVALETRPDRVLLASEARDGARTPAPIDFRAWGGALAPVVRSLLEAGIDVAALVPPELEAVKAARSADAPAVELYVAQLVDLPGPERREALERLSDAARLAAKLRLGVGVGGALDGPRAGAVLASCPVAEWVTVGRAWAARAVLVGIDRATRDLRERIA
jgi:pyridoxine 5-phosphate synthase